MVLDKTLLICWIDVAFSKVLIELHTNCEKSPQFEYSMFLPASLQSLRITFSGERTRQKISNARRLIDWKSTCSR